MLFDRHMIYDSEGMSLLFKKSFYLAGFLSGMIIQVGSGLHKRQYLGITEPGFFYELNAFPVMHQLMLKH